MDPYVLAVIKVLGAVSSMGVAIYAISQNNILAMWGWVVSAILTTAFWVEK